MASVSVYRCYAKCVFDIKILILPTQENGWLSVPPTELCNINNNNKTLLNKKIYLKKYCLQLTRLFDEGQCVQNIKIETKAINIIIILSRGLIQLSG